MENYREFLTFDHDSNNFNWKGNVEELKSFVHLVLNESEDEDDLAEELGEIVEDPMHKAVSYKLSELSLRLYSTETLKLFGAKSGVLRDIFHKILGTFEPANVDKMATNDGATEMNAKVNSELNLRDKLDSLRLEMALIREQIKSALPSADKSVGAGVIDLTRKDHYHELVIENIEQGRKICKLQNDNQLLNEEVCNYRVQNQKLEEEKQSLVTAMRLLVKETTPNLTSQGNANQQNDQKNKMKRKESKNSPMSKDNQQNENHSNSLSTDSSPKQLQLIQVTKARRALQTSQNGETPLLSVTLLSLGSRVGD